MSRMISLRMHCLAALLSGVVLLGSAATVGADPKPLSKEEQAKVDQAIDKGIAFLKRTQHDKGDWPVYFGEGFQLAQTVLPAYALLESGLPANDPTIQKAAKYVRPRLLTAEKTYEISLALLFLDRLDDPKDKPLIRSLGMRLISGQRLTGGWNYRCPLLDEKQEDVLHEVLAEFAKRQNAGEKSRVELLKDLELPRSLSGLVVFRDPHNLPWQERYSSKDNPRAVASIGTDNSNTQFALLGLWAAQRHDVPCGPTLRLAVERFERTQYSNGRWSYFYFGDERSSRRQIMEHPSMMCAGLLGLAIGRGLKLPTPGAPQPGAADIRVLKGLAALSEDIGIAAGGLENYPTNRGTYYLWSVERVAMLFDLPTIGDKDWYRWGAGILLAGQQRDGSWTDILVNGKDQGALTAHRLGPGIDTSFALLFLKRSHPMKDLTPKLPSSGKGLNQAITRLLSGDALPGSTADTPSRSAKPER